MSLGQSQIDNEHIGKTAIMRTCAINAPIPSGSRTKGSVPPATPQLLACLVGCHPIYIYKNDDEFALLLPSRCQSQIVSSFCVFNFGKFPLPDICRNGGVDSVVLDCTSGVRSGDIHTEILILYKF